MGRWESDDADRIPVEFGADGSIKLALHQRDWKWVTAEGSYLISDDGKVKYKAKLGGLAIRGHFTMKGGVLIGPSGLSSEARWKKLPKGQVSNQPPAASERDPEEAFRKACELVAGWKGKHDVLKGVSKVKPAIERDEQKRLKSANFVFEYNVVPPGKGAATAKDNTKPFFYVSVQVWSGRTQSPPANLHEFEWQGRTYQMWVRVFGSDLDLVTVVRNAIDELLRAPPRAPEPGASETLPGSPSSLEALAPVTNAVLATVAKEKAEIKSRHAAHLSTQTSTAKGEVIAGGGFVFYAQCRQKFQVLEILHGNGKLGDRVLEYGIVEKTEGFPLPAVQSPIPVGARLILLIGEKGNLLKAVPDNPENRKAVRTALSEQKGK